MLQLSPIPSLVGSLIEGKMTETPHLGVRGESSCKKILEVVKIILVLTLRRDFFF